jgi:hypothetical protein
VELQLPPLAWQYTPFEERNHQYLHHTGFGSLRASASDGCDSCQVFTSALIKASLDANPSWTEDQAIEHQKALDESGGSMLEIFSYWDAMDAAENLNPLYLTRRGMEQEAILTIWSVKPSIGSWTNKRRLAPQADFPLIKSWIMTCTEAHEDCVFPEEALMPKRVLDVGSTTQEPRLVETGGSSGRYLTLSNRL